MKKSDGTWQMSKTNMKQGKTIEDHEKLVKPPKNKSQAKMLELKKKKQNHMK